MLPELIFINTCQIFMKNNSVLTIYIFLVMWKSCHLETKVDYYMMLMLIKNEYVSRIWSFIFFIRNNDNFGSSRTNFAESKITKYTLIERWYRWLMNLVDLKTIPYKMMINYCVYSIILWTKWPFLSRYLNFRRDCVTASENNVCQLLDVITIH